MAANQDAQNPCACWSVADYQRLSISQRPNAVLDAVGDLTNLLLVDDKRRRRDQCIAKGANKDAGFETVVRHGPRPLTGSVRRSFDLYGAKQAEVANIAHHAAGAPDIVNGGFPFPGDARDFLEDAFLLIDIEGGKRGGAGQRVAGVGEAMGELDRSLRSIAEILEPKTKSVLAASDASRA
jgi:hypothetical protein